MMAAMVVLGAVLGAQFGNPAGFSQGDGKIQCTNPRALPGIQCTGVTEVTGFAGTFTVKRPNIEVLLQLTCNDLIIWTGERWVGTSDLSVSWSAPITGQCWFAWQEVNNNIPIGNLDFEYQIAFH